MSSRELKTSHFSLMLRTRENSDVFNTLDEIYLELISSIYFTSKIQLFIFSLVNIFFPKIHYMLINIFDYLITLYMYIMK